jgi:N-carbamoylputrescine amidase
LFYPTAIGWHPEEKEQYGENQYGAWMNVMKGHGMGYMLLRQTELV